MVIDDTIYYYQRQPDGLYSYKNGVTTLIRTDSDIDEYSFYSSGGRLFYSEYTDVPGETVLMCYDPLA